MESSISWLARRDSSGNWHEGFTFNAWSGCYVKSPGCANCYAKNLPPKMRRGAVWGRSEPRVMAPDAYWKNLLTWNNAAARLGLRMPVFCQSTSDLFERHVVPEENEKLDVARARLFRTVPTTPWLDYLLLTKEPENILDMVPAAWRRDGFPRNVWVGATVESNDERWRLDYLREVPAVVRFISAEPLIGRLDPDLRGIHWVLCGGESGRGERVRPMHPDWARSLRDQCIASGTAFHFKQHGAWAAMPGDYTGPEESRWVYNTQRDAVMMHRIGKHAAGRILDGRTWDELPTIKEAS